MTGRGIVFQKSLFTCPVYGPRLVGVYSVRIITNDPFELYAFWLTWHSLVFDFDIRRSHYLMKKNTRTLFITGVALLGGLMLGGCGTTTAAITPSGNTPTPATFSTTASSSNPSPNETITVTVSPSTSTLYYVSWKTIDGQGFLYQSGSLSISVGGNFSGITTAETTETTSFGFQAKTSGDQFALVATILDTNGNILSISTMNFTVK